MCQPLYCSAADAGVWGVRSYGDGSTPYVWLSSMAFFHGCLAFHHRNFPPQSPASHPLDPSLRSQQQPSLWDGSTIPKLQFPAAAPSRGWPASLSRVGMAAPRTVWLSFYLAHRRSAVSLSALSVSPLTQTVAPLWGSDPCFSSPPRAAGRSSATSTPVFPLAPCPTEFCVVLWILFRCSGTPVCSQLVFCMRYSVWSCIPDVSVERELLHIHLLLCRLFLPTLPLFCVNLLLFKCVGKIQQWIFSIF